MNESQQFFTKKLLQFRDERNWKQFHTLKNLPVALSVEVAELAELTQWKTAEELENIDDELKMRFEEEIADIFIYLLLICEKLNVNLQLVTESKIKKNAQKHPIRHIAA